MVISHKHTFMLGRQNVLLQILRGTLSTDRGRWRMVCCSAAVSKWPECRHPGLAPPGIDSTKHKQIQGSKGNCYPNTSSYSPWIQSSRNNKPVEAITAQYPTVSFRPISESLFPGPLGSFSAWLQRWKVLWSSFSGSSKENTTVTEGILGPPLPGIIESSSLYQIFSVNM